MLMLLAAQVGEGMGDAVVGTLALSIAAGGLLMALAKRLRIPGIVLLLFGGVLLGPEGIGIVQPSTLGPTLNVLVAVAVGLILFEGGLTLDLDGFRAAPRVIRNLLTIGVVVTWILVSLLIWLLFPVEPVFAVLAGSLVIVTGPTVVQPILKRIRLKWNLHNILHWEGVLIDPIGVFLAVLAYEWVAGGTGETAFLNLLLRILGGLFIGYVGGEALAWILKRRWVPEEVVNIFTVGAAMLIFGLTEVLIAEGGLLSVTVAGLVCGSRRPPALKEIIAFKSVITDLLIGFVFILLTARLQLEQFLDFGWNGLLLVGAVILLVRPLAIRASTIGTGLDWREQAFLSWVAPRGVVAASMASLFTLTLVEQQRFAHPDFLESFVYSVIFATVLLQGPTAAPLARLLRLLEPQPNGWLIVGAHPLARELALFLERVAEVPVAMIDGNRAAVAEARALGLRAFHGDARDISLLEEREELHGVGRLLALTDNEDLNELLCRRWADAFGRDKLYRWASPTSSGRDGNDPAQQGATGSSRTGCILWSWMPKPSMTSSELVLGEAELVELEGERLDNPGDMLALFTASPGGVVADPKPGAKFRAKGDPRTLYLRQKVARSQPQAQD